MYRVKVYQHGLYETYLTYTTQGDAQSFMDRLTRVAPSGGYTFRMDFLPAAA